VNAPFGAFGSLRARYFGPQPLIEDDSAIGKSSLTFDARVRWKFRNIGVALDILNLLNAENNDIAYYYTSASRARRQTAWRTTTSTRPSRGRFAAR
jgi:hypothetical protein